jgi:uncharacterized protein YbcI
MPDTPEEIDGQVDPERSVDRHDPPSDQEITDEISAEILRIHEESYGKGAESVQTFLSDGYVVVVLDDLELLPNEKFLVDNGKRDSVTHVRAQYQFAIQSSFRAAVERATGRTVVGFASANNVEDPAFATEIFKLG